MSVDRFIFSFQRQHPQFLAGSEPGFRNPYSLFPVPCS